MSLRLSSTLEELKNTDFTCEFVRILLTYNDGPKFGKEIGLR